MVKESRLYPIVREGCVTTPLGMGLSVRCAAHEALGPGDNCEMLHNHDLITPNAPSPNTLTFVGKDFNIRILGDTNIQSTAPLHKILIPQTIVYEFIYYMHVCALDIKRGLCICSRTPRTVFLPLESRERRVQLGTPDRGR